MIYILWIKDTAKIMIVYLTKLRIIFVPQYFVHLFILKVLSSEMDQAESRLIR